MSEKKKCGLIKEFKEFISRGNVIDMAVGIIIGSAFTAVVQSVVKDIINPFIGWLIGNCNFNELSVVLVPADEAAGVAEVAIKYGMLIQNILNFLIIGFVLFIVVKAFNRFRRKEEAPADGADGAK